MARQLLAGWRWFDDGLRAGLTEAGFGELTSTQSMVIPYLDPDGTRPVELARRLGVTRQAVHQLVSGLAAQGLIELVDDPTSSRSKLVRLTERGEDSIEFAEATLAALEGELTGTLGEHETLQLRRLLEAAWPAGGHRRADPTA